MEFAFHPDDAARLTRLKHLALGKPSYRKQRLGGEAPSSPEFASSAFVARKTTFATAPVIVERLVATSGDHRRARLTLDGADAAVRDFALLVAQDCPLTPPRMSFDSELQMLAREEPVPPPPLGAPPFDRGDAALCTIGRHGGGRY